MTVSQHHCVIARADVCFTRAKRAAGTGIGSFHPLGQARAGARTPAHAKKREILGAGGKVLFEVVFETDEEFFALDEEARLIRVFGRANLTNQTDAGEGATGAVHSPETIERRAAKLRGRKHPWLAERNKTLSKDPEVRRKISEARTLGFATGKIKSPTLGKKRVLRRLPSCVHCILERSQGTWRSLFD